MSFVCDVAKCSAISCRPICFRHKHPIARSGQKIVDEGWEPYKIKTDVICGQDSPSQGSTNSQSIEGFNSEDDSLTQEASSNPFLTEIQFEEASKWGNAPHSSSNCYKCNECDVPFVDLLSKQSHEALHSIYKCKKCEKLFKSAKSLREHKCSQSRLNCAECGKSFARSSTLNMHLAWHKNPHLYKCNECAKCFQSAKYLRLHLSVHSNPDIYKCDKCDESFKTAQSLKEHKFSHTGSNKCDECGKPFQTQRHLQAHLAFHLNPQRYQCPICGRGLANSRSLKNHIEVHSMPTSSNKEKQDIPIKPVPRKAHRKK